MSHDSGTDAAKAPSAWRGRLLVALAFILLLIPAAPFILPLGQTYSRHLAVRNIRKQIEHTVSPDDLRVWADRFSKAHPGELDRSRAADDFIRHFPTLPRFRLHVWRQTSEPAQGKTGLRSVFLFWDQGSDALKVSIFLNDDGSPFEMAPEMRWAPGIGIEHLHK